MRLDPIWGLQMYHMWKFIKTTIIGGLVFLLPIATGIVVVAKAGAMAVNAVSPLADRLPFPKAESILIIYLLSGLLLVLICFLAGVAVRSLSIGNAKPPAIIEAALNKLPPYVALKKYTEQLAGMDNGLSPALVRVNDGWQIGFVADTLNDGHVAVFLPASTDGASGGIYIFHQTNVTELNISREEAIACLRRSGRGLRELLDKTSSNGEERSLEN
jgi:uncharacterized membrane protein